MAFLLNDRWVNRLCDLPEHGMGYQIVDVLLRSGERVQGVVVLNAREVQWPANRTQIAPHDIVDIKATRNANPGHD